MPNPRFGPFVLFVLGWCALAFAFGPASIPPQWNAFVLLATVCRDLRLTRSPTTADHDGRVAVEPLPA
jgi:hypothetical protein